MNSFMYDWLSLQVSSNYQFGLATRLVVLAMGEVLSFGFDLAVSFPSDRKGSKARIVSFPSRITRCFFIILHEISLYIMSSCLRRYSVLMNLIL